MIRANKIDPSTYSVQGHFGLQQAPGVASDLLIRYVSMAIRCAGPGFSIEFRRIGGSSGCPVRDLYFAPEFQMFKVSDLTSLTPIVGLLWSLGAVLVTKHSI